MKTPQRKKIGEWTLPDECIACGAEHSYVRELTSSLKSLRGETFTVQHHQWKCSACGVGVLGDHEIDEAMRATVAAYQEAHGLLTASSIREARKRMQWSQEKLASKCGLGIATIKRLELGTVVQTESNDAVLRCSLGTALDGSFDFLVTECFGVVTEWQTESEDDCWYSGMVDRGPPFWESANSNNELALAV